MNRYKIVIEYDGTNYHGWQKQYNQKTIQEAIEGAIFNISQENVELHCSGRTDAGVHATGQVAHFDLKKKFNKTFSILMGINHHLKQEAISIIECNQVDSNFHSRFNAKERFYQYKILNRYPKLSLDKNRMWQVSVKLDENKMQESAKFLIGKHDFSSFRDSECQSKNPIRTINNLKISRDNNLIIIDISAKSFLHHMVRNIVGTLILVGKNKITPQKIKEILNQKDRTKSGENAPAYGLYLTKVVY